MRPQLVVAVVPVALGGRVYDVLGELFEGHALRDLLVDAIRYRPEKRAELFQFVEAGGNIETSDEKSLFEIQR